MTSWFFNGDHNRHRYEHIRDGQPLDQVFQSIERSLLLAERNHRRQLQTDLARARGLLLDAILAIDARVINDHLTADPHFLSELDMDGWEALLREARQSALRRPTAWRSRERPPSHEDTSSHRQARNPSPSEPHREQAETVDPVWLTPSAVRLPNYPLEPPRDYRELIPGEAWHKWGGFLVLTACTGWASQSLLSECLSGLIGRSLDNIASAPENLAKLEFLRRMVVSTPTGMVALVELKHRGIELVNQLGLEPVASEWQRLRTSQADIDRADVALRIIFAVHARKRGYGAWVCPEGAPGQPDVLLKDPEKKVVGVYVEPDLQRCRLDAWRLCAGAYGTLGLCAMEGVSRDGLARAAVLAGLPGCATDFLSLRSDPNRALWIEQWLAADTTPPDPAPSSAPGGEVA